MQSNATIFRETDFVTVRQAHLYFRKGCGMMVVSYKYRTEECIMKTVKLLLSVTTAALNIALTVMLLKKLKEDEDKLVEYYKK